MNDPHGIVWTGTEYHLFFQHLPGRTTWAPDCHWGHATSSDLVHWEHRGVALAPAPDELGCWTGSVVLADDGPRLYYTSVVAPDCDLGRVRLARPRGVDLEEWVRPVGSLLVPQGPDGLDLRVLRDPYVWQLPDGSWRMILGAAIRNHGGAALHYISEDGLSWDYDGVLCSRETDAPGEWTGQMWECPALFPVGDDWVLLFGVWHESELFHVVASIGRYDGHRFEPRSWQRLTWGDTAYATTTFVDEDGRRCAMHWLRERPDHDPSSSPWAGALSLPQVLTIRDGMVRLELHPNARSASLHLASTAQPDRSTVVLTDVDIVETFDNGIYAAHRLPPITAARSAALGDLSQ
jgi:beta-fructofuranosidase